MLIDEYFLQKRIGLSIDFSLPLRLQKRALLNHFGFPMDHRIKACRVDDSNSIKALFSELLDQRCFPFLVITSEKPARTLIPPLFEVYPEDKVVHRNDLGDKQTLSFVDAQKEMAKLAPTTWLEFSPSLWGNETIAGRLLFTDEGKQVIELQQGVKPAQLLSRSDLPVFSGQIDLCNLSLSGFREVRARILSIGFNLVIPQSTISEIIRNLSRHLMGFIEMAKISPLPTYEFAFSPEGDLFSIDIDWPAQWVRKGGL